MNMPENPTPVLVSRSEFRSFMNTAAAGAASPTYTLMGEGFSSLTEAKNPKEYSRQYVHEKTERTDVVGYATSLAYTLDAYTENPVIARLREVHDKEQIGTAAQVEIVNVNLFDGAAGTRPAFKRNYNVIPDSKGDGTDALVYSGTLKAAGDITFGTWAESTNTFTADET
jgi:hypothetical protein